MRNPRLKAKKPKSDAIVAGLFSLAVSLILAALKIFSCLPLFAGMG